MRSQIILVCTVLAYSLINLVLTRQDPISGLYHSPLPNFSPFVALFFCSAQAFRGAQAWLLPLLGWLAISVAGALTYDYSLLQGTWLTGLCYGAIFAIGFACRDQLSKSRLFALSLSAPVLFYLVTNGVSFIADPRYAKTLQGAVQAFWTGLPGDSLPTWHFFRNSLIANSAFSACFYFLASRVPAAAYHRLKTSSPGQEQPS